MNVVGAGLGDHVDHAAAGAADFGTVSVGVYLELLYRVLAEAVWIAASAGAAGGLAKEDIVAIGAIDQQAVRRAALTAEGEIAASGLITRNARGEQGEIQEVAAVDGQVGHRFFIYDGAGLGTSGLDHRHFRSDADLFLRRTHFEHDVNGRDGADVQSKPGPLGGLEPLHLRSNVVAADRKAGKGVEAAVVRLGGTDKAGRLVGGGDLRLRHGRTAGIDHRSVQGSASNVRLGKDGIRQQAHR